MEALGLIETCGLLPAIESADVMLKAAEVELVGKTFVGGGLVTVAVTGDAGAVKAAVDAGATAVTKINQLSLISQHVIPRPHQDIESIITVAEIPEPDVAALVSKNESQQGIVPEINKTVSSAGQDAEKEETQAAVATDAAGSEAINFDKKAIAKFHKEDVDGFVEEYGIENSVKALAMISVVKLRHLAREYKKLGVTGRDISKANRELLIRKLQEYYETEK